MLKFKYSQLLLHSIIKTFFIEQYFDLWIDTENTEHETFDQSTRVETASLGLISHRRRAGDQEHDWPTALTAIFTDDQINYDLTLIQITLGL